MPLRIAVDGGRVRRRRLGVGLLLSGEGLRLMSSGGLSLSGMRGLGLLLHGEHLGATLGFGVDLRCVIGGLLGVSLLLGGQHLSLVRSRRLGLGGMRGLGLLSGRFL